jgi:hypothetical protein
MCSSDEESYAEVQTQMCEEAMEFAIPVYKVQSPGYKGPEVVIGVRPFIGDTVVMKHDLPSPTTRHWVVRRKAEVAAAVAVGLLSWDEVTTLYRFLCRLRQG